MKKIIIRDFGPIKQANILLKDFNVVIGEQSIGKSCVLKVACYCTWVEKRIEIEQDARRFEKKGAFIEELVNFHRLTGYNHRDTYIEYESDYMKFSFDNRKGFSYEWKEGRWKYKRPKVSYIPAERNLVAVIPNWFEVKSVAGNIQEFMADWSDARKSVEKDQEILNLHVSYHYDDDSDTDLVKMKDGSFLPFANVSSGLQSLIPLYVHLLYINSVKFRQREHDSVQRRSEIANLSSSLMDYYGSNIGKISIKNPHYGEVNKKNNIDRKSIPNPDMIRWFLRSFSNISRIHHCEVFLEEPEENLFPSTQIILMRRLLQLIQRKTGNTLFISTHSPYILDALLEKKDCEYGLFYIQQSEGGSIVKTATEEDIQDMYEDGVDAFFNIERFGDEV